MVWARQEAVAAYLAYRAALEVPFRVASAVLPYRVALAGEADLPFRVALEAGVDRASLAFQVVAAEEADHRILAFLEAAVEEVDPRIRASSEAAVVEVLLPYLELGAEVDMAVQIHLELVAAEVQAALPLELFLENAFR